MTSGWYLGHDVVMNTLGDDEDGDMSMRANHGHSSYLEHRRGRVVEYAIRDLDGDPSYASGERGLSGGAGTQTWSQVKLWVLVVQIYH